MVPWCKYSQQTNDVLCRKCEIDNSLRWGDNPCYCILYKPSWIQYVAAFVENLLTKSK